MLINSKFVKTTGCKADGKQVSLHAKSCKGGEKFTLKLSVDNEVKAKRMENDCPKDWYMIAKYVDEHCDKNNNECAAFSMRVIGKRIGEIHMGEDTIDHYVKEFCW